MWIGVECMDLGVGLMWIGVENMDRGVGLMWIGAENSEDNRVGLVWIGVDHASYAAFEENCLLASGLCLSVSLVLICCGALEYFHARTYTCLSALMLLLTDLLILQFSVVGEPKRFRMLCCMPGSAGWSH